VFKLLSYRSYTIFELEKKLKNRKISKEEIEKTINFFKKLNLIDDRLFAKQWIEQRIRFKPRGKKLIEKELLFKGISKELLLKN
ncbi:MAG: regulatory protein RecX, partial [bacterium]